MSEATFCDRCNSSYSLSKKGKLYREPGKDYFIEVNSGYWPGPFVEALENGWEDGPEGHICPVCVSQREHQKAIKMRSGVATADIVKAIADALTRPE